MGTDTADKLLWISDTITRDQPPVSAVESMVFHGWVVPGTNKQEVVLTNGSSALVFPRSRPHILDDRAGRAIAPLFPSTTPIRVWEYEHRDLLGVLEDNPSRVLSGREKSSEAACDMIRRAGLKPIRETTCHRLDVENLTHLGTKQGIRVSIKGCSTRRIVLDKGHIEAGKPYFCSGLCVSSPDDQRKLLEEIDVNSGMYLAERVPLSGESQPEPEPDPQRGLLSRWLRSRRPV